MSNECAASLDFCQIVPIRQEAILGGSLQLARELHRKVLKTRLLLSYKQPGPKCFVSGITFEIELVAALGVT